MLRHKSILSVVVAAATFALSSLSTHAAVLVAWDPQGNAGNEAAFNSTTTAANMQTSTLTRGVGITASTSANTFNAINWDSATQAAAVSANEFFQFAVVATPGFTMSLSQIDVNIRRGSTGPSTYRWQYSFDGFATPVDLGTSFTVASAGTGVAAPSLDLTSVTALQDITSVTFRLYGWGATNTDAFSGIGRLDGNDLVVSGEVIPEPATTALLAVASVLMITRRRRVRVG